MLVVLAIIGIVTTATLLTIAPSRGGGVKAEAQLLAKTIENVADEARVREVQTALVVEPNSYRFTGIGIPKHVLAKGIAFNGVAAAELSLELDAAKTIELSLTRGDERWVVTFDGVRARATEAGPVQ